jgi:hypothetical protein
MPIFAFAQSRDRPCKTTMLLGYVARQYSMSVPVDVILPLHRHTAFISVMRVAHSEIAIRSLE